MKAVKTRKRNIWIVIDIVFSLLLIPCGLAAGQNIISTMDMDEINTILLPLTFLFMAAAVFMRAIGKRYRNRISDRRCLDFILSVVYLACAVILMIYDESLTAWMVVNSVYIVSFIPGRILFFIRERKWYMTVLSILLILLLLYLTVTIWFVPDEETQILLGFVIMFTLAIRGFFRIMSLIFSRIRLDLLRDIVRRTYAAEIVFGLVLLIFSFSWVLIYMDPSFENFGDALWYCFAVVTTIGFGDITATSLVGRILSVILGMAGIVVVALITSIIVNFYGEMKKAEPADKSALESGDEADGGST